MKKRLIFGILTLYFTTQIFFSINIADAMDMHLEPEYLRITDNVIDSSFPACFPHRDHQKLGIRCSECHHGMDEDGNQVPWDQIPWYKTAERPCYGCHNKDNITLENKIYGITPIQRAGHGLCIGCHMGLEPSSSNPDPLGCKTCHFDPCR